MSTAPEDFAAKADEAFKKLEALVPEMEAAQKEDTARYQSLKAEVDEVAQFVTDQKKAEADAKDKQDIEAMKAKIADLAKDVRAPSKANVITGEQSQTGAVTDFFYVNLAIAQDT